MAAIWTDLFETMLDSSRDLRWSGRGPGIGRDARIAYSSLIGRYVARAYLTGAAGVCALMPLDEVKCWLRGTRYAIRKDGRGHAADWIGIGTGGLEIAEAKGSFDSGIRSWRSGEPHVLRTAIEQARRTTLVDVNSGRVLPARRWAIASRWGTIQNKRDPTLIVWDPEEEALSLGDYMRLARILLVADLYHVLNQMGHSLGGLQHEREKHTNAVPAFRLRVGDRVLARGFLSIAGPFGIAPIHGRADLRQWNEIAPRTPHLAVLSFSYRYARAVMMGRFDSGVNSEDARVATRNGLTVVWPESREELTLVPD